MKRLKIHIVKSLAILICIIYIIMPINVEIRSVLYTISHSLKAPTYLLQHNKADNHKFVNQQDLEIKSSSHNHTHEVLDFFTSIFESTSNTGDSQKSESNKLEFKINKHITNKKYALKCIKINDIETSTFWLRNQLEMQGYLNNLYRPPQV